MQEQQEFSSELRFNFNINVTIREHSHFIQSVYGVATCIRCIKNNLRLSTRISIEGNEIMSNTKTKRNSLLAVVAVVLTVAAFTGCGKKEKTEKESGKTEVFADDLRKGNVAYEAGDYEAATEFFRIAAQEGNSEAQVCLGRAYYFGMGIEQNSQEAVKWFRLAADQGNPQGQFHLSICYLNGEGIEESFDEALQLWFKAAEQGVDRAQFNLGNCYHNGKGVPENKSEAVKWYCLAANQGNSDAMVALGFCYLFGEGVKPNKNECVKWMRKSAELGNQNAQKALMAIK